MIRILLVDDEPELLELEKRILEQKFGFFTIPASSGKEALEIFQTQPVDAIISDYAMPLMDGITLLREIRAINSAIPFILFTVREKEDIAIEAMNCGANFYAQKESLPQVVFAELARAVKESVGLFRAEKSLKIQRDLAVANADAKNLDETLHLACRAILDVSGMDGVAVYLYEDKKISLVSVHGNSKEYAGEIIQAQVSSALNSVLFQKEPRFRDELDIRAISPALVEIGGIKSDGFIGMSHRGKSIGIVHLFSYGQQDIFSLSLQQFVTDIIVQVSGYISDRLAEEALINSENRMKAMIKNLPGMVYQGHINEERSMEFVSEAVFNLTGYYPGDIIHNAVRSWGSFIHPPDRVKILEVITRAIEKNVGFRLTYRITTRDNKYRWVSEQGTAIYDEEGNLSGIEGIIMDITRKKSLDDQVRLYHTRLKTLFMLMTAGCVIFKSEGTIESTILVDLNGAAEQIERKKKRELIGTSFTDLFLAADQELHAAMAEMLADKKSRTLQRVAIIYPYGNHYFDIFLSNAPIGYERKDLEIFLIYNDVTSRVFTEQQIITSLQEKELLLKEVHHRVKNNLQIISGILKLQSMRIEDPRAQEIIHECRNQVYSMASIHELLYNSKNIGKIRVEDYISRLVDHFKQEYEGTSARIKLIVEVDPEIVLDIERCIPCGLILNELIMNAVKHAFKPDDEGQIKIFFSQDEQSYRMEVTDDGQGLPEDFDVRKAQSLGMELTTRLAHQLRGRLEISGEKGTRFLITFPKMEEGRTV